MEQNDDANKPYDLTSIYAISSNNPQFLKMLLQTFAEAVNKDLEAMKEAAKTANWDEVKQLAHKLKPSLAHFGINSLKDVIRGLEYPLSYDAVYLGGLLNKVYEVMDEVFAGLRAEFPQVFNT